MADRVLVDTDVLIDVGRGVAEAVTSFSEHERDSILAISVITQLELLVGCANKRELQKLERFLRRFDVIKLSAPISDSAVDLLRRYRLSHGLLIADGIIAAAALTEDMPFLTKKEGLPLHHGPSIAALSVKRSC